MMLQKMMIRHRSISCLGGLLIVSITGPSAMAKSPSHEFASACPNLAQCAKSAAQLLHQKYLFAADLQGKIQVAGELGFNQNNAELLFTRALYQAGYSRVPVSEGVYQISPLAEALQLALPEFICDSQLPPRVPDTWDLVTIKYKASHLKAMDQISETLKPFMPTNSRVFVDEANGVLMVTDVASNIKKNYALMKEADSSKNIRTKIKQKEK